MTIQQLICRAASTYPDAYVLQYFDLEKGEPKANPDGGDTLAQFIALEIAETFDPEADDGTQIATAIKAIQTAADDLGTVAHALSDLAVERLAA